MGESNGGGKARSAALSTEQEWRERSLEGSGDGKDKDGRSLGEEIVRALPRLFPARPGRPWINLSGRFLVAEIYNI